LWSVDPTGPRARRTQPSNTTASAGGPNSTVCYTVARCGAGRHGYRLGFCRFHLPASVAAACGAVDHSSTSSDPTHPTASLLACGTAERSICHVLTTSTSTRVVPLYSPPPPPEACVRLKVNLPALSPLCGFRSTPPGSFSSFSLPLSSLFRSAWVLYPSCGRERGPCASLGFPHPPVPYAATPTHRDRHDAGQTFFARLRFVRIAIFRLPRPERPNGHCSDPQHKTSRGPS